MGYVCDNHPDTPADVLITLLASGDVLALCGPDFPEYIAGMHHTFEAVAAEQHARATDPNGDESDEDEHADDSPPPAGEPETPVTPAAPDGGDGPDDDQADDNDQADDDGDQLAEDQAQYAGGLAYLADVRKVSG